MIAPPKRRFFKTHDAEFGQSKCLLRSFLIAVALLILMMGATPAPAAAPSTKPAVPALIVGAGSPKSFIVNGITRLSRAGGVAFYVATDGRRQLCAAYDSIDGTPLFISDGQQTLVYDLARSRIVRVPSSRGHVQVDWRVQEEKPLEYAFGVRFELKPENLKNTVAFFRVDRFAAGASSLTNVGGKGNVQSYAATRRDGGVESLQIEPGNSGWFRFTSMHAGDDFCSLELEATDINGEVPDAALAFPDAKKFPTDVHLVELEPKMLPVFLTLLRDGGLFMTKLGTRYATDAEMREGAEKSLPSINWDELRKRDASFGRAYREALAEQGLRLRLYRGADTAQPGH